MHTTLVAAAELARQLGDENWRVVDCRFDLGAADAGEAAYRAGHIPGAVYAHLDRDLSSPITPTSGRHPLPEPQALACRFSQWGIGPATQVIAYDAGNGAYAARLWWLLRWLGHAGVAVLDGGYAAWLAAGCPIEHELTSPRPQPFSRRVSVATWVGADVVAARAGDPAWRLLDARAPERYAGVVEPIDAVAGHVPGASNYPFTRSLGPGGRMLPAAELRATLSSELGSVAPQRTIVMCGSGVTACHVVLALEAAGLTGAQLYAGSWSEWIRDPDRPVATGGTGATVR
jgi:thiosulfate/3-mercaptopyruvate sulfurtransferase